ncbi:2-keto-4-pentenoate hydratase [Nonomuraea sp. NPDC049480]|uniref:2-keto-4-pentenoate hydratase n=1 Tax=Nonomuraea sp. NPDC049480 TaxID=3364353 RepID=UPI003795DC43
MYDEWSQAVDVRTQAAERLAEAVRTGKPCAPIRDLIGGAADAYAVQEIGTRRALGEGRRLVGRKIGVTNPEVQRRYGVDQPDYGMLFADMAHSDGLPIPLDGLLQPRAEVEVALVFGRDLTGGPFTVADVIRAVEFALPAIEIADSRIADWDVTLADMVADNAAAGAFVLGATPVSLMGLDLRAARMTLTRGGAEVSTGSGAACLGNPLNAAVWLASQLGRTDYALRAGDVVLTGSLGPLVPAGPGDAFEAHIEGLGSVRAVFSK